MMVLRKESEETFGIDDLRDGDDDGDIATDSQLMEEERMRAEEGIYNTHLDAVKEEV